jgi:hypothetical protein
MQNLLDAEFQGSIFPVNPKHRIVAGMPAYSNVQSLPSAPDLAVICTPPQIVPQLIADLGARGTKGAIVITAGFAELGNEDGRRLQQAMLDQATTIETVLMPSYTHLRRAQAVLWPHYLLAYFEMLARDWERFGEARRRANVLPLGSGALAGSGFPFDREAIACASAVHEDR